MKRKRFTALKVTLTAMMLTAALTFGAGSAYAAATLGNVTRTVRKYSATGLTHIHSLYPQSHRTLQLSQT